MAHSEIRQALRALGYTAGQVQLGKAGHQRYTVTLDGERIGIYDLAKHTFVD